MILNCPCHQELLLFYIRVQLLEFSSFQFMLMRKMCLYMFLRPERSSVDVDLAERCLYHHSTPSHITLHPSQPDSPTHTALKYSVGTRHSLLPFRRCQTNIWTSEQEPFFTIPTKTCCWNYSALQKTLLWITESRRQKTQRSWVSVCFSF